MSHPPLSPRAPADVESLFRALRTRRRTFFGWFGAVLVTTLGGSLLAEPNYQAIAIIQLLPHAGQEMDVAEVVTTDAGYLEARDRARTQMQIIQSRAVREEVARRYNALDAGHLDDSPEGLDTLARSITVTPREDTQLVEISVLDADPERAARLANLVAEVYCEANLETRTATAREAQRWLDDRAETVRAALRAANAEAQAFREAHVGVDLNGEADAVQGKFASLQTALAATTTERALLSSRLDEHRRLLARGSADILAGMFDDPGVATLTREQATLSVQTADVLSRYGVQHPAHQMALAHQQRVDTLIAEAVRRNVDAEAAQLAVLMRQERAIRADLEQAKDEVLAKERLGGEYAELELDEERARRLHGALVERGAEVELQAESRLNDVRVLDRALPPSRPLTPDLPLNLAAGLMVGLVGGVGAALAHDRLDDRIRSGEAARSLGVPLLGVIPLDPATCHAEQAMQSGDPPPAGKTRAFLGLRRLLHGQMVPGGCTSILVTSCLPGEGRTHVALGLAIAFAELGSRVLLVDVDGLSPRLHLLLGAPENPGFGDALAQPNMVRQYIRPTSIPNLHVLPRGTRTRGPGDTPFAELDLLSTLQASWPIVILDGAAATDPDVYSLAPLVDGVVLVARHGVVPQRIAARVVDGLQASGAVIDGVVLNGAPAAGYGGPPARS